MALPASGPISMSMVNTELGYSATAVITLNDAAVRTLFNKSSGAISLSDGYGKSAGIVYAYTGVIDTIGYREFGRYFDGIASSGTTGEVTCTSIYGKDCTCCGTDAYDECNSCDYVSYDGAPNNAFIAAANGGYYDPTTNSGFVDLSTNGLYYQAVQFSGQCGSCVATEAGVAQGFQIGIKKNGTLWAWGYNYYGQLGLGNSTTRSSPVQVGAGTDWASVSTTGQYGTSLAIKTDGTLWTWGANVYGERGTSTNNSYVSSPVQVGALTNWSKVSGGQIHVAAIKTDGTLWAWGYNGYGHLGDGTTTNRSSPVQIGAGTNWSKVSAGYVNTYAIKTDGTLWAWGYNPYGQVGDGTTATRLSPVQIGAGTNWASVEADTYSSAVHAIKTDGTLWGWGYFQYGGNGIGSIGPRSSPVQFGSGTNHATLAKLGMGYLGIGGYTGYPVITTSGSVILYNNYNGSGTVDVYTGGSATGLIARNATDGFLIKNVVSGSSYIKYTTQKAIFGYGYNGSNLSMTNLVSNTGVVATDTTGVGTGRWLLAAAGYGTDKAIFGYGYTSTQVSMTNKVSNTGVVSTDTTGVGTSRGNLAGAGYGSDKAIFGYGYGGGYRSTTNLVSNTGVVATDTTGVGTARQYLAAAGYGMDKAIFGYGTANSGLASMTNLVSNTGVVSTDTTGVGTTRRALAAAGYSV